MSRPRMPDKVAEVIGAKDKNRGRFEGREGPAVADLGAAPVHLNEHQAECWELFRSEMPWLGYSDRTVVEMASRLRSQMMTSPEFGVNAMAQLRLCISSMGGTPADRSKVTVPEKGDDDAASEFLN